ncbi:ATP-binding protein [Amphritea sp. 1_MG-2023]|uniref:ATP-binding protein n=1 Tax=Amphritea sp. 1_MG-2023 TaxID=3062670 RepID=UPI0026E2DF3B|nr:ATP-binding protein [Amphritea sp. 1_MG-2023]MDO6561958.1 ATP-binding protein [Amphritea sp. 1_MG-2023]
MSGFQKILKVRRHYNKWVADQTLEDYALRFTARKGRHMSISRVGKTALGAASFLALEGLAAAVTLSYGFTNTVLAMIAVCVVLFITGFPIVYYSAKHGLDIDLLTRGAGFGYLGSTLTSLIYASFTFIFFAIEAAILASALKALFGIPLAVGYLLCAVAVIPIVTHGITAISRFQVGTQNLWLGLQLAAVVVALWYEADSLKGWTEFSPSATVSGSGEFDLIMFGAAVSVFFALFAQIGEQVDYLRFMPEKTEQNKRQWWFWLIIAGPGWVFTGFIKMLLGSFLAYLAITQGISAVEAADPTYMYQRVFQLMTGSPEIALLLAALMVVVCQMKINVTNAYAGSIAWSNFFSRLTHSHPGRVVWLVFNVTIALILMELGIYQALEAILGIFAIIAISWLASLSADLLINKPLGLSPPEIEFKRGHLYDINPVGMGSMIISTTLGMLSYLGLFGEEARYLCHFVSLLSCFICVPLIAWLTGGRYYIARSNEDLNQYIRLVPVNDDRHRAIVTCGICENDFEREDMSFCPAYDLPICSLCCSLDVRCLDSCKPKARLSRQMMEFLHLILPRRAVKLVSSRLAKFVVLLLVVNLIFAALLAIIFRQLAPATPEETALVLQTIWTLFFTLFIASGVVTWLFLLTHESRLVAQQESNRQTMKLTREIEAHEQTDLELQQAKELAERANAAKSRYLSGISHELRTPLQSILGYAQLLRERSEWSADQQRGLDIIHRSGLYLTDLIEGLLDISKIEAGRLDLHRNQVNLPELIEQLVEMFRMQALQKGIEFNYHIATPLPQRIVTDEKRLRQILINLLSNAVKYTPTGRVDFDIRYRNQVAEFAIRDTGPGIDEYQLQRIFAPFERIRNRDTAHLPGTGLGLTIVKLLTEIMGGDLQVESHPGKGSCFRVSMMLPWVSSEALTPVLQEHRIIGYEGYQQTLCLVDDDPVLRGLLADILMPLGFSILEAQDAEACLALLQQSEPDLFLLDISMPGMSGLQLASLLRQRKVPGKIVMLSADARELSADDEGHDSYDDYLVKPVANHQLLEALGRQLELKWIYRGESESLPRKENRGLAETGSTQAVGSIEQGQEARDHRVLIRQPDHPLILELKNCAELGYRKGVIQCLNELEGLDILSLETLSHLRQLSDNFLFDKLVSCLETQSR